MNKLDKMKKMVDGILGDDDLCEVVDKADTSQTETHDLRTEAHECVKQTDCPWK